MTAPTLYHKDGIIIFLFPANRIPKLAGSSNRLVIFRNGDYSFTLECKANEFAKRMVVKLFKKIGYDVQPQESLYHTNFIMTDKKQKFAFTLKYGLLPKPEENPHF